MKIEIYEDQQNKTFKATIWTGPDGIDSADFVCSSLGECFEEIKEFIIMTSLTYSDDIRQTIKSYFSGINLK